MAASDHLHDNEHETGDIEEVEGGPTDPLEDSDMKKDRIAKKFIEGLRKIGPFSKQILNYSYPPLLYQRGEEEEEESQDQGECDDDEDDDEEEQMLGHSPGGIGDEDDLGQLPEFRDSDDELRALGGALPEDSGRSDNLDIDDENDDLLNNLK